MTTTNPPSFFAEPNDLGHETRELLLEVTCRLLFWMADASSIEDRGLRTSVALYCIRPDLVDGQTLAQIGDVSGRTRQHIHKLVESFRLTIGLHS